MCSSEEASSLTEEKESSLWSASEASQDLLDVPIQKKNLVLLLPMWRCPAVATVAAAAAVAAAFVI